MATKMGMGFLKRQCLIVALALQRNILIQIYDLTVGCGVIKVRTKYIKSF